MSPSRDAPDRAAARLCVLRLCSVFEPPASALDGRGASFDPIGGIQEHTGTLTRVLDRRGVVQAVLTTRPPTAPSVERIHARATVVRVGLPVRRLRQLYALPAAVLAPLLASHADIVHVHLGEDLALLPLAALAARPWRLPIVLTIHASSSHTLLVRDPRTAVLRGLGGWLERRGARGAAATIVFTSRLAGWLEQEVGCEHVQQMRRGIDREAFARPGRDPFPQLAGGPRVVFLGRLVAAKGVATLVEAAARLRTPDVEVLLVGDGSERARVERAARRLGVAERVHVTGFVRHEQVPAVLASADVLVLPSLYEELGTVLIEAMQAGLPAVASRVGGIPELVQDHVTGLLVEPGDASGFAAAIDTLLADRELAGRLGANAAARAPLYDVKRAGAEVHELYERVATEFATRRAPARGTFSHRVAFAFWPV